MGDSSVMEGIPPPPAPQLWLDCGAGSRSGVAGGSDWGVRSMGGRGGAARAIGRAIARSAPLVAALVLVGTACSKSSSSSSELTTVFVQKFRYHGMPTTLKSGVHQILFENRESLLITHEMIPIALPAGKTAQDVINDAKSKGPNSEDEWLHIGRD